MDKRGTIVFRYPSEYNEIFEKFANELLKTSLHAKIPNENYKIECDIRVITGFCITTKEGDFTELEMNIDRFIYEHIVDKYKDYNTDELLDYINNGESDK